MRTLGKIRTPALTALAALASLGLALCGSSGQTSSTGPARAGDYVGSTAQGLPISFTVTPTTVAVIRFAWQARCADGQLHSNIIVLGSASLNAGAFSAAATLDTGASSSVDGRVAGTSASGTVSRSGPSAFGTECRATGISWQAHRHG